MTMNKEIKKKIVSWLRENVNENASVIELNLKHRKSIKSGEKIMDGVSFSYKVLLPLNKTADKTIAYQIKAL